jgi:hypothetical protein
MTFNIIFHEVLATKDHHETIIVKSDDEAILFDPALPYDQVKKYNISKIFITDSDEDCWSNIDSYPDDIEVFSNKAILEKIVMKKNKKLISIKQGTSIGFLKNLRLIKLNPEVGRPATGVRFRLEGKEIVIAPELPPIIGKAEKNLMKNAIHIVGVGNFEKGNHKITFLKYTGLCDKELHPSAIYLTNLRKDILDHKKEVEKELGKRNGKLMKAGDVLISKEMKKEISSEGDTKIKKWKIPFKPQVATNEQLRDDFRLFVAVFAKLDKGEKVRIQADGEKFFTKEILYKMVIALLKEIIKRKKAGSMKFTISEEKSESYEKFFNNLKRYLSSEEISILTNRDEIKKNLRRFFSLQRCYWIKNGKKTLDHYCINLSIGNPKKFWRFSVLENPIENIHKQEIFSYHYCDDWEWFFLSEEISPSNPLWSSSNKETENCSMVIKLINKGRYTIKKLNNGYQIAFYCEDIKKEEEKL